MADETEARDPSATAETKDGAGEPAARHGLQLSPVQLALYAGWTMAVLYGTIGGAPSGPSAELPTVSELGPADRRTLELARLGSLLAALLPDFASPARLAEIPVGDYRRQPQVRQAKLQALNLDILTALTAVRPEIQLAYELGRSLRDTANPRGGAATDLAGQLARGRIATLREWLATLTPEFPPLTASVVAGSLGRWSELATVTVCTGRTRRARNRLLGLPLLPPEDRREPMAKSMCTYLRQQGDIWLMLLIGELTTSGLLTPAGYVAAGEAALGRSAAIIRGILRHYWLVLLCVAVALAGTLFLAARYLGGASKVWTSIALIAGALGASAQAIASTSAGLAAQAERPVFAMAEEDAMAWAITTLPPLTLTFRGTRHLRRAGIPPATSLGRC